jgi:Aspartate/tyrosine/aromatic aminotransferase
LLNDATPILMPTREEDGYAIDSHELERLITPRTKAIILNSPCNPTGATYDRTTLERLAELALRRDLLLISDEIYEKVLYDGRRTPASPR